MGFSLYELLYNQAQEQLVTTPQIHSKIWN
jgi:hypothetical protein